MNNQIIIIVTHGMLVNLTHTSVFTET